MKPRFLLFLLLTVLGGALLPPGARALETGTVVVVTLKDGERFEGILQAETEQALVVETSQAGGTILQTRTFPRDTIGSIVPLSAAELQQRALVAAYEATQRYRLNPAASSNLEFYDQVIDKVLRPFLERFPDAPQAAPVAEQLAHWEAERQRVADGEARFQGTWMPAAEAARLIAQQENARRLSQARALLDQQRFERVLEVLRPLATPEARALRAEVFRRWLPALDQERQTLETQVGTLQGRVAQANTGLSVAKQAIQRAQSLRQSPQDGRLGSSQKPMADLIQAQNQSRAATAELNQLQARLEAVNAAIKLRSDQARSMGLADQLTGTGLVASATTTVTGPQTEDYGNPRVLSETASFGQKYWPLAALTLLVILLIISRAFGR